MQNGGLRTRGIIKSSQPDKPLITVVTVVYNGEATLEQTIQSVVNQTYDNVEYIIIDGASTDGTLDIIKKYEDRIDYWQSAPDKGIYDAMNKGIGLACGDYISLLNSGDWYENNAVSDVITAIKNNLQYDIFYGMMRIYSEDYKYLWVYGYGHNYLEHSMISHPTSFVAKKIYAIYKYNLKYKSAADYDLFLTLFQKGYKFYFIEKILANYILGGMSDSFVGKKETSKVRFKHKVISLKSFLIHFIIYSFLGLFKK